MRKLASIVLRGAGLLASVVLAFYLAAGGWARVELEASEAQLPRPGKGEPSVDYQGLQFESQAALDLFLLRQDVEQRFGWPARAPKQVAWLLTALAFGYLGGVIKLLHSIAVLKREPDGTAPAALGLSAMTGLLVLAVTYALPTALTVKEVTVRPVALLFFCVFTGIYSERFMNWLEKRFKKSLPPASSQSEE